MNWRRIVLLACSILLGIGCSTRARETDFRVVVLGFDGVDPRLVQEWIEHLPNIRRLAATGSFTSLGTTNPPESPVAWASFATGMNPGKHGIFDFLKRDPETYFPDIGLVEMEEGSFLFNLVPIRKPRLTNNRKGLSYWKHLDSSGIRTYNLRLPIEYPPERLNHGRTWVGLGVPDIRGTWGTYFYLATDLTQWDLRETEFGGRLIKLEFEEGDLMRAPLDGPRDPRSDAFERIEIPLELELTEDLSAVVIRLQGQEQTVEEREWSDWFRFSFSAGPFVSLQGISRFFVLETFPEVRLYLMPISQAPDHPPLPISDPAGFSASLADRYGLFKTVGWIHETWGLNEEQIDEEIFLQDLFRNMDHLERVLLDALDDREASLYTAVSTATDSVAHMFYRLIDPEHPRYNAEQAERYGDSILKVYQRMDAIIGRTLERLDGEDVLIVISDHGFHSWRKEFNTNTWLARNGYLTLKGAGGQADPTRMEDLFSGGSFFPNVSWPETRAYSLGLGQIYINLKGREGQGSVEPGEEYLRLTQEIRRRILEYRDPDTEEPVLEDAFLREEIYQGPYVEEAGDIQLSFLPGYRTSWQTSLGAVPPNILVANLKKWSGDHSSSSPEDTHGFFLSNRRLQTPAPAIVDIAPTLYSLFGVEIPADVDGRPLALQ
ncbi:MAG TPA: alkaline phosphatase family protein [Acidobacteriota bacterium]|nr:alkaline phosphatase family protein [Acidobacteriota bacterium]